MKKGSLSLSINAIVILVLAIAMLGLGLGFTKGMFAKFSSKLDVPPPNIPATAEEPVVLPQEELEIKHGKDFAFSVNFYNDYADDYIVPSMMCSNLGYTSDSQGGVADVLVADQTVTGGVFKGFKFIVLGDATTTDTGKTDICTIAFDICPSAQGTCTATETKQITVKIT